MRLHNRQIKVGYWNDQDLIRWPLAKRVLFQGLWCIADDSGCCLDDSWTIKVLVFPSPVDADITPDVIKEYLDEMAQENKIIRYASQNKACFYIKNFHKYQRLDNPAAPEVPLPEWIIFEPYPSNKRAGKYIISNPSDATPLLSSYESLTESLQTPSNLEPRTKNLEPKDMLEKNCDVSDSNNICEDLNNICGDATSADKSKNENIVSLPEKKRQKRQGKTTSDDGKDVAQYLQIKLKAAGVNHFPRDWLLKNYSTADRLLGSISKQDLMDCIVWTMDNQFWRQRISDLLGIEKAYMQWVREAKTRSPDGEEVNTYENW